jgi:transcriptional regulator with XRE-family HTH domain
MKMQDSLIKYYHKYDHQQCFVGHSHKAPWRDDIISACEKTLPKFGLHPWYADDQFEPTKSLRDKVVEMVANARYGIYDLSWWRPDEQSDWKMPQNVLIELGMAIALNRPTLLLRHAENRASGLPLPTCLDSISQRIVEFSGGPTLKQALEERLPQWLEVPPERAWWMRYCLFGERTCTYRESYPQIIQCGQKTIGCHIADGKDIDRPDFRSLIEDELGRYSDISFDYLDALLPTTGYDFRLCTYCQIVRSTPFAIYRITPETTAETFIAIGMSIALEKQFKCEIPKFIFTTDARSVPSLLTGYEVVEAKTTKERQKRLRKFIPVVMRKVRESMWKPESLPFVEFSPQPSEISLPEKEQPLFSENTGEHAVSNSDEDIEGAEVDDANELALKQLEEDIRLHPNNAHIYNDKGEATAALRRYEEALNAYNKAIELEADNPAFYFNRGRVHLATEKYEQALEDFDKAIVLNPGYPDARRQRDMLWDMLSSLSDMPFHQKLKVERRRRDLSQAELADKLGINSITIRRWETGTSLPRFFYRKQLSDLFEMNLFDPGFIENSSDQSQEYVKPQKSNEDTQRHSRDNQQLRNERLRRGWSQEKLAELIDVDVMTINRWEMGKLQPQPLYQRRLCELYGMNAVDLGLTENNSDQSQEDIKSRESNENAQSHSRGNYQLRHAREERRWTQRDLAEKLSTTGVTISRWESGVTFPSLYFRQKLCQIFDKTEEELGFRPVSNEEIAPHNVSKEKDEGIQIHSEGNQQFKRARFERGWSLQKLAEMIGTIGVITISRWERGIESPSPYFRQKLCKLFNMTEEELGFKPVGDKEIASFIVLQENDEDERKYCEHVINQLTPRQKQVLEAFAGGLLPSEVAELLSISPSTISTHTTVLLSLCHDAWSVETKERLDYRFLQLKFKRYFEEPGQSEDK